MPLATLMGDSSDFSTPIASCRKLVDMTESIAAGHHRSHFSHPLDAMPWFRSFRQTPLRDLLYTLLLSVVTTAVIVVVYQLTTPGANWLRTLIRAGTVSLCIGFAMHLLSLIVGRALWRWIPDMSPSTRATLGVLTAMIGVALGYWLGATLTGLEFQLWSRSVLISVWWGALFTAVAVTQRHFMLNRIALEREHSARLEAERLMTLSRLQMLQAQIEPHFLFNTLANVSSLIEVEPQQARKMLDQFTLFLRASLDQTRKATTSLGAELQVIEAYLSVLKARMGERLTYRIDAPQNLLKLQVPAMLLQPIVENAVKHGIEPRLKGGTVQVDVKEENGALKFVVADDGVGFVSTNKENVGLGAVRERLTVQFGAAASLTMERTPESLTRVIIQIPMPK